MSMFLRIGAVTVVGFAFSTSASVNAMEVAADFDDLLSIDEAPLTNNELSEARGGFSFGGFNFDFGVEVSPVEVLPSGGPFGAGGVFGESGGPFGESGGPFGESGGPFGNSNPPENTAPAETVVTNVTPQSVIPTVQSSAPVSQSATPTVVQTSAPQTTTPAPAPVTVAPSAPTPTPTPTIVQSSAPTPVATQQSAPPSPAVSQAPANTPAATMTPAPTPTVSMQADDPNAGQTNQPSTPTLAPVSSPAAVLTTVVNAGEEPTSAAPAAEATPAPSMSYETSSQNTISQVTQRLGPNGRSVIIDNNMNGVMLRQTIDVNVRVLNFNSRINRAIADTVTATLTSRNLILNSF